MALLFPPRGKKKGEEKIEGEGKRELQGRHQRVGRDTDEGFVSRQRPEREDDERERTKGRKKKHFFERKKGNKRGNESQTTPRVTSAPFHWPRPLSYRLLPLVPPFPPSGP